MSLDRKVAGPAWLPPVIWMIVIIWFSGEQWGTEHTGPTVASFLEWFVPSMAPHQVRAIHVVARKGAHLAEYAVLALLWFRAFTARYGISPRRAASAALAISAVWAGLDETRQSFAANRMASPIDVLIDSGGAALALVLIGPVRRTRRALSRQHQGNDAHRAGPRSTGE